METVRDLILLAGKKWRVFASGETPSADELADGLSAFQSLIDSVAVGWTDLDKTSGYTAKEDERIRTTATVTLPTLVDGDCGQRRPRQGAKVLVITGTTPVLSLYRGDLGAWMTANALTLDSPIPLDASLHNTAADALAGRYCDMFGEPTPTQYRAGLRGLASLGFVLRRPYEPQYY